MISSIWKTSLRCTHCHDELIESNPGARVTLNCVRCTIDYEVSEGIYQFTNTNEFYEKEGFVSTGTDFSDSWIGRIKRYFARHHYLHDIARHVPAGSKVVEIGCGGGSRFLASRYQLLGVDLSTASTRQAATIYPAVIRADCVRLPLASGSVDAVVSSFILEHFEGESFEQFFAEMARVLRPGGRMVHYFDLENDAPFTRWAKTNDWYQALFIDERGHHCLRSYEIWEQGFARHGFITMGRRFSCKSWLQDLSIWSRLGDHRVAGWPGRFGRFMRMINLRGGRAADVAMCLYQDVIESFQPDSWASKVIWVLEKRS